MEPQSHPDYERVLTTVAELLDRLAESDLAARARMDRFETDSKKRYEEVDKRLDRISVKLDEATDRINGLLDLMNRHINEPHPRQ